MTTGQPGWAREIVAKRAVVVASVTALVHFGVVLFALPPTLQTEVPTAVGSVIDLIGVLALVLWARADVTPADPALGPQTKAGVPLVPVEKTLGSTMTVTITGPAGAPAVPPLDRPCAASTLVGSVAAVAAAYFGQPLRDYDLARQDGTVLDRALTLGAEHVRDGDVLQLVVTGGGV